MNEIIITNQGSTAIEPAAQFGPELVRQWVEFLDAAPATVATYSRNVRPFFVYLRECGEGRPTRQTVINYREWLKTKHAPATVNAYLMALHQFFKFLQANGMYPDVMADRVTGCKIDKSFKRDFLTSAQVKELVKSVDRSTLKGLRDYAIIVLMLTTGLRTVEVMRANLEDLRTVGDSRVLFIQGKGHEERADYVKVAPQVEAAINAYQRARGKVEGGGRAPLFASIAHRNAGARMTTRSISRICKDAMLGADIRSDRLTAHSFRHTAAATNLKAGGTLEETMELLRHKDINTTRIYSHMLERENNKSEMRIADAILGE